MGHERIGHLPDNKKWRAVVARIAEFSSVNDNTAILASQTTKNVASQFKVINQDPAVQASFVYLLTLLKASGEKDPKEFLRAHGIELSNQFSPLELARSIKSYNSQFDDNKEYSAFASQSLIETLGGWLRTHKQQQSLLFDVKEDSFETWRRAANAGAFSELSRLYFSNFISCYLKYFLEREASASIRSLTDRELFNQRLNAHVQEISRDAFETAKVAQSYSAAWYNKNAAKSLPSKVSITGYVSYALKKLGNNLTFNDDFGQP